MDMNYNDTTVPLWVENQSELSLNLGRAYAIAYAEDKDSEQTAHLFSLYKDSRRAIPRNQNGRRFGSYDAYMARDSYIGV